MYIYIYAYINIYITYIYIYIYCMYVYSNIMADICPDLLVRKSNVSSTQGQKKMQNKFHHPSRSERRTRSVTPSACGTFRRLSVFSRLEKSHRTEWGIRVDIVSM